MDFVLSSLSKMNTQLVIHEPVADIWKISIQLASVLYINVLMLKMRPVSSA